MANTCTYCGGKFQDWKMTHRCDCNDGIEETHYEWDFPEPGYRICTTCKGEGEYEEIQRSFCCEDCIDEYINEM